MTALTLGTEIDDPRRIRRSRDVAACFGLTSKRRQSGTSIDVQALRAHCASALASYKVPKHVLTTSAPLPRTRSGKLLRRELR